ncbi:MAG: PKD domain-containing protein, partial [Bdellovibrionales bacterium]|nr:PKD domain-containing protein [Bdellovibrionales bacterium]
TGNGESRVLTSRTITASEGGRYFLTLKNGDLGPRSIEQCETEDTIELKRECLFNNLTEKIDQDFSRIQDALIHLNGVRVRNHLAPNEKTITRTRGLLKIPVNLVQGANTLNIDLLGYSTSKLFLDLEKAPETPLPPFAAFTLNRLKGNTTQSFNLNARESFSPEAGTLTYSWLWGDEPEGTPPVLGTSTATHIYQTAGTYRAKLIVTDTVSNLSSEFGIDLVVTAIDPVNPPENEKPRPVIQMALDSENPMRIHLNGLQSTDDGTITNYTWRITNQSGQHTNLTGETLSYTFTQSGSYTIRLTVTDDLGLKASLDRVTSVAPLSLLVRDEILFLPKQYFGTFETESQTIEPLNIPQAKLAVLKIKNADGEDHLIEDCSTIGWPEKISCLYTNLVNSTYIKLYRVNTANVYVNGRKVTDSTSITKQKKYFETIISLNEVNTLDIRVRGWPTAFISVEVQALETNIAPIASFTFPQPTRGVPQTIEFNAASSTDENDQIVSYRFLAKKSSDTNYSYDSDWIATPNHQITFAEAGTWDVVVSARDKFGAIGTSSQQLEILPNTLPTLTAVYNILSNQSPFRVQVRATGQDLDGDTLQYNFSFSNGQTTGFQSSNVAISNFAASGQQQVVVTVRDQNGGENSTTLNFELGNNLIPIASFAFATARAGYAPLTVAFDASLSSDPDGPTENLRYFWQFGDGTPLTEGKILEHTFQNGGEYLVTLSVVDAFRGTGTQSRAVFSWVTAPPIPRYTVTPIPGTLQVTLDAS